MHKVHCSFSSSNELIVFTLLSIHNYFSYVTMCSIIKEETAWSIYLLKTGIFPQFRCRSLGANEKLRHALHSWQYHSFHLNKISIGGFQFFKELLLIPGSVACMFSDWHNHWAHRLDFLNLCYLLCCHIEMILLLLNRIILDIWMLAASCGQPVYGILGFPSLKAF